MKRKKSILLAECVLDLADLLASYLTKQGFDVSIATDGAIAKKKLLSSNFDFLITDVVMSEVDGVQLLTWLSQRELAINVVVSSGIKFELLPLFNEKGVIMKLSKPYTKERLVDLVAILKKTK